MAFSKPSRDAVLAQLRNRAKRSDYEGFRNWFNSSLASAKGTPWESSVTVYSNKFWRTLNYDSKTGGYLPNEAEFDALYATFAQAFVQFVTLEEDIKASKASRGGFLGRMFGRGQRETTAPSPAARGIAPQGSAPPIRAPPVAAPIAYAPSSADPRVEQQEQRVDDAQERAAEAQERTAEELEKTAELEQRVAAKLEEELRDVVAGEGGRVGIMPGVRGAAAGGMAGGKRGAVIGGISGATGASAEDAMAIYDGGKAVMGAMRTGGEGMMARGGGAAMARGAGVARGVSAAAGAAGAAEGAAGIAGAAGMGELAAVANPAGAVVAGVMAVNKVGSDMMQKQIDTINEKTQKMNSGVTAANKVAAKTQSDAQKEAEDVKAKAQEEAERNSTWGASARKYGGAGVIFHPLVKKHEEKKAAEKAKKAQEKAERIKQDIENVSGFAGFLWLFVMYGIIFALTGVLGDFGTWAWIITLALLFIGIILFFKKHAYLEFKNSPYGPYAAIAYIVHLVTLRYFYSSGTVNLTAVLTITFGVYLVLGVIYWIFFKGTDGEGSPGEQKKQNLKIAAMLLAGSIAVYSLPGVMSYIHGLFPGFDTNLDLYYAAIYLTVMVSPWLLYALRRMEDDYPDGNAAATLRAFKLVVIAIPMIIIIIFLFTKAMAMIPNITIDGVDAKTGVVGTVERLQELFMKTGKRWLAIADQAKNPGAYYTGKVEENKKQPLGVTIENLYSVDKQVTVSDSEIVIVGEVKAKSFIGASILVTPSCAIESKLASPATVDPPTMEIIYSTTQGFQCTFPPMPKTGTYTVKAGASFPFETWAYIPYHFVDEERARNIARQGQNVQKVLGIPSNSVATYTSGPIRVGMGGSSMPLLVRPDKDPIMMPGSQIGLTIDNGWDTGGTIQRVKRIELKVPQPFVLSECTRPLSREPYQDEREPTYNDFVFINEGVDKNIGWSSITCKLEIPRESAEEAFAMVAQGDAVTRSFIAVVEYDYSVEKSTTVQVK